MLTRYALVPLAVTLSLGSIACKHASSPELAPKLVDSAPSKTPPPFLKGLTVQEYVAVLGAAGCKDPVGDSAQCAMCPDAAPITIELFPGDFTRPGQRGVVVSSPACKDASDGTPTTHLRLVEQNKTGSWSAAGTGQVTHLTQCREAADLSRRSHLLCVAQSERYGTTSTYHVHMGWTAGKPEPSQTTLVEVAARDNCALNYSVTHAFKGPAFEATSEGAAVLVLEVTTRMGAFTKALDACPEEGFQGPIKPERATQSKTTKLTFDLTEQGPRERDGKGSYISLGAEFEALMEQ